MGDWALAVVGALVLGGVALGAFLRGYQVDLWKARHELEAKARAQAENTLARTNAAWKADAEGSRKTIDALATAGGDPAAMVDGLLPDPGPDQSTGATG